MKELDLSNTIYTAFILCRWYVWFIFIIPWYFHFHFQTLYNNNSNNNNKSNNDDEKDYNFQTTIKNIRYSQINRSFMLIAVGYLSQLFVYRIVENNIIMHYSNGGLGRLTNEELEWLFINPFVRIL